MAERRPHSHGDEHVRPSRHAKDQARRNQRPRSDVLVDVSVRALSEGRAADEPYQCEGPSLEPCGRVRGVAYVSWACAVMAEVALGYEDIAAWPERWPDVLPRDREPIEVEF